MKSLPIMYTTLLLLLVMTTHADMNKPLRVFAAAGTAPAMKEIAQDYTLQTGTPVIFNFANAGTLAKQICAGAEFDLFFSANDKWMDYVAGKNLIAQESRHALLTNEMVIIVPKGSSKDISLSSFSGRFAIGDQATPLGIYARQAFRRLGCWDSLQSDLCVGDTVTTFKKYGWTPCATGN